jgi:hypothetical protein
MGGQGNVKRLLQHEEVNFQRAPNQVTWLRWRWRHHKLVVVVIQGRFLGVVPFKGEHRKKYKKLMLGLIR